MTARAAHRDWSLHHRSSSVSWTDRYSATASRQLRLIVLVDVYPGDRRQGQTGRVFFSTDTGGPIDYVGPTDYLDEAGLSALLRAGPAAALETHAHLVTALLGRLVTAGRMRQRRSNA